MRAKKIILASMALGSALGATPRGAADLVSSLTSIPEYQADATFEVLLPQAAEPVVYDVVLQSRLPERPDSLSPCDYLIRWSARTSAEPLEGFSAYFSGDHYRYRNARLQEYHAASNPLSFQPAGPGSQFTGGVHTSAQFADMLPQMIGNKIERILSDPSYIYSFHPDTIVSGRKAVVLDGVKRGDGYDLAQFTYVFDSETLLPVKSEFENSPGSISEQIVTVTYSPASSAAPVEISEAGLMSQWPEVFEKYRESTFKSENLAGALLPKFACRMLDSTERYTHNLNEPFSSPVVIVVIDPEVATARQTIDDFRDALDMSPMDVEVVWAFKSNREDDIRNLLGKVRPGETALVSAGSLIRECGVTMFPTTLIVDRSSKVRNVVPGFNKDTPLDVLQKVMLIK